MKFWNLAPIWIVEAESSREAIDADPGAFFAFGSALLWTGDPDDPTPFYILLRWPISAAALVALIVTQLAG